MVRPAVKELKKSEAMNKSVVDELVHGAGTKNKKNILLILCLIQNGKQILEKKQKKKD